ncbi:MAG: hypothetical protein CL843_16425 [Crocinitomicaceae bacterium]|nr:hypothetical protein [Crocinitomicaceae bacterium]|tara:strand:+ start:536 stop:862 length:327 start_codon:yes stop_codon:yes gene_type:complete
MATQKNQPVGGRPTPELLEEWKKKYGRIHQLKVGEFIMILREPKTVDIERALAADPKGKKVFNFNRSIIENCKLYEDAGAREDDKRLQRFFNAIDQIIDMQEADVKEL